jgi:uncharacterized protein (DUF58 family)
MRPTRLLLAVAGALLLLGLVVAFFRETAWLWAGLLGLGAGVAAWDALAIRLARLPAVGRELETVMPVDAWSTVRLVVSHPGPRVQRLLLHDHQPAGFEAPALPVSLTVPAGGHRAAAYRVRPHARGDHVFVGMDVMVRSRLGLWDRKVFLPLESRVRVFPNFREVGRYALLASDNRLSRMGVFRRRHRGEGSDFLQLREYRVGDTLRQIDWKATSRYRRLISKEYRDERDQQVIFMLDCGHRMRHRDGDREHLDQALNALLLLAHVVIEQGDGVGLLTFGGDYRWYPPTKTRRRIQDLIETVYDLGATSEAADYLAAAQTVMPEQRRRALVVLITNTRDEDQDELLLALKLLKRKHLVVVADMREQVLDATLRQEVSDLDGAFRFHAVNEYLERRRRNQQVLRHHGHYALDILPHQLPVALVNQYLSIKAAGRL